MPIFYDESYRLPFAGLELSTGVEPRRVDFTTWYLLETGVVRPRMCIVRCPSRMRSSPGCMTWPTWSPWPARRRSPASSRWTPPTCRWTRCWTRSGACAEERWRRHGWRWLADCPVINMAGGYHHAAPGHGGGFCAINDIAVALAALRDEGFEGSTVVLDLDAHPPDGTAACFAGDSKVWIGSISGSDWGVPLGADEVLLPDGSGDTEYLAAAARAAGRMPRADMAFVIAGGDVLRGDRFGRLGHDAGGRARAGIWPWPRRCGRCRPCGCREAATTPEAWKVFAGSVLVAGRPWAPAHPREV